ncbi:hypothetical protein CYMTET_56628 [Cymbomonas tetramitiformis]|uniref:Uncharacterized protein n=1 Tax=Cymbomonas tetramitiformis TaxID=36881 RepID=A0AAE0BCB0_9CHLO|nr:hypothetical protein CYMTET_56628 [Cymbomonas tetramitiformis]
MSRHVAADVVISSGYSFVAAPHYLRSVLDTVPWHQMLDHTRCVACRAKECHCMELDVEQWRERRAHLVQIPEQCQSCTTEFTKICHNKDTEFLYRELDSGRWGRKVQYRLQYAFGQSAPGEEGDVTNTSNAMLIATMEVMVMSFGGIIEKMSVFVGCESQKQFSMLQKVFASRAKIVMSCRFYNKKTSIIV